MHKCRYSSVDLISHFLHAYRNCHACMQPLLKLRYKAMAFLLDERGRESFSCIAMDFGKQFIHPIFLIQ